MSSVVKENELEKKLIEHLSNFDHYQINTTIKDTYQLIDYIVEETVRRNPDSFDPELLVSQKQELRYQLLEGDVFDKAKLLREGTQFSNKNNITLKAIDFIDFDDYSNNKFEIISQLNSFDEGVNNRYDVVLLINGFPLVHIELKRQGIDVYEAINQLGRYKRQIQSNKIMDYTQFFIVSNQVCTYYIANQNKKLNKEFAITWSDENNNNINNLLPEEKTTVSVVNEMLNRQMVIDLLSKYFLLDESNRTLIVLRPYQINAVKSMFEKVQNYQPNDDYRKNSGYIYHATGSGKTLTSFTTAKLVAKRSDVKKVIFVVDRIDLAEQTKKEYNRYGQGIFEVPSIKHTGQLIDKLNDSSSKIVVTTVQKLSHAIKRFNEDPSLDKYDLANNRVVVIFDEGHRSIAGDMGNLITHYFHQLQMFGFTGTPIFAEQSDKKTHYNQTEEQFGLKLAEYNIKDAIHDNSVLPFKIEYYNVLEVEPKYAGLEKSEIRKQDNFIKHIAHHILQSIYEYTDGGHFNAMAAVDSVQSAKKLYEEIKEQLPAMIESLNEHEHAKEEYFKNFKCAVVFSVGANNDDESELKDNTIREWYNDAMVDFANQYKNTLDPLSINVNNQDAKKTYTLEVSNRVKENKVDLLIVCSMFLTGFDAPCLNTLYLSKDQQDHNLIQSFARTNRKADAAKIYGNIVYYLGDKEVVDRALNTYSGNGKYEEVTSYDKVKEEYQELATNFLKKYGENTNKIINSDDVEYLESFLRDFRQILRYNKLIKSYKDFKKEDIVLDEMYIRNMSSVYQNINRRLERRSKQDKDYQFDFDPLLELVETNVIDLVYINKLHNNKGLYSQDQIENMINSLAGDEHTLQLIREYVYSSSKVDFSTYIEDKMNDEIVKLANEYNFDKDTLINIVHTQYVEPPITQIRKYLENQGYKISQRASISREIDAKLNDIIFKYSQIRGINE